MRRRRFAAVSVFVLVAALSFAPSASAAPSSEGFELLRFAGFLLDFFWSEPAAPVAQRPESVALAGGGCSDPSGFSVPPGPSCPVPPPAVMATSENPDR